MMPFRGVQLSYETIRRWCDTFAASYAAERRRHRLGAKRFLDEVFLEINGVQHSKLSKSIQRLPHRNVTVRSEMIKSTRRNSAQQ